MEQDTGVEPAFTAWEAVVLPIYESCVAHIIADPHGKCNRFLSAILRLGFAAIFLNPRQLAEFAPVPEMSNFLAKILPSELLTGRGSVVRIYNWLAFHGETPVSAHVLTRGAV